MKCFEEGWTLRPSSFFDDSGATDYSDLFELNITSGPWAKHSEMVSEGSSNGLAASVIARKLIIKPLCSVLYFSLFVSQLFCCTFKVMAYRKVYYLIINFILNDNCFIKKSHENKLVIVKYYDDGSLFLTKFQDGTGTI